MIADTFIFYRLIKGKALSQRNWYCVAPTNCLQVEYHFIMTNLKSFRLVNIQNKLENYFIIVIAKDCWIVAGEKAKNKLFKKNKWLIIKKSLERFNLRIWIKIDCKIDQNLITSNSSALWIIILSFANQISQLYLRYSI